jgi:hypothetical protein
VPLNPLGYSDPRQPSARSLIGRRGLYADGYRTAGDRLVDSLSGGSIEASLIYPILYVYRHHLELKIKELTDLLIAVRPELFGKDPATIEDKSDALKDKHGLKALWNGLEGRYPKCSSWASKEYAKAFRRLLIELDDHDPSSQAARYETDRRGNATLNRLRAIDPLALKRGIHMMSNYLGCVFEVIADEVCEP